MVLVCKDVIKPGVYFAGGRSHTVTPEHLDSFVRNFKEMRQSNMKVPVPWEHPATTNQEAFPADEENAEEVARRERHRLNSGWVEDLYVDEDGTLKTKMNLREEDARKLSEIGGFVSPQFGTFIDGRGRTWNNAITHIALTNRPINDDQSDKFELVQFSLADIQGDKMADDDVEKQPAETPEPEEKEETESSLPEAPSESPKDLWPEIREALSKLGIMIPDTAKVTGDLDVLLAAIASSGASRDSERSEAEGDLKNSDDDGTGKVPADVREETQTVSMSIEEMNGEIASLREQVTISRRNGYLSRIDDLLTTGRITATKAAEMKNGLTSYQFSKEGTADKQLETVLSVYEELPQGAYWTADEKVKNFSVKEERASSFFNDGDDISDEEADKLAAQLQPGR